MKIIAHRGGPSPYLESSLNAIDYSFNHGADGIETDLRLSSDGVPFGIHDDTLYRLFGDNRYVKDCSSEELSSLGSEKSGRLTTIEEIIKFCNGKGFVLIHFKEVDERVIRALEPILSGEPNAEVVYGITSIRDMEILMKFRDDLRFLAFINKPENYKDFDYPEVKIIRLWEEWADKKKIEMIHDMGKEVWIMAGRPIESLGGVISGRRIAEIAQLKIEGLILNDPALI